MPLVTIQNMRVPVSAVLQKEAGSEHEQIAQQSGRDTLKVGHLAIGTR